MELSVHQQPGGRPLESPTRTQGRQLKLKAQSDGRIDRSVPATRRPIQPERDPIFLEIERGPGTKMPRRATYQRKLQCYREKCRNIPRTSTRSTPRKSFSTWRSPRQFR